MSNDTLAMAALKLAFTTIGLQGSSVTPFLLSTAVSTISSSNQPKSTLLLSSSARKFPFARGTFTIRYLTWGFLQEWIMTQSYGVNEDGSEARFTESLFLVFINRVLALVAAVFICNYTEQPVHRVPLYKYASKRTSFSLLLPSTETAALTALCLRYSFTSISNVMSSFFQYEALKFVGFPTQVSKLMQL